MLTSVHQAPIASPQSVAGAWKRSSRGIQPRSTAASVRREVTVQSGLIEMELNHVSPFYVQDSRR